MTNTLKTIDQANIQSGTRVFVRCDLDVPINSDGILGETYRLDAAVETLKFIISKGGMPVIAGHIGKPNGQSDPKLSTKHLLPYFNETLGEETFELLENLRFDPREETNDPTYAQELISQSKAEIYVNESFATSHRKHASIVGIPQYLPAYAGLRLQKEIETLSQLLENPQRPFVIIIGGAKLESKLPVVSRFLESADFVVLGGKLGQEWKTEIPENLVLPTDYAEDQKDIGPNTIARYIDIISRAKTILWAGPLGAYETPKFMEGTKNIAQTIIKATSENEALSIIGGGDTITACDQMELLSKFSFVSTGGGAMLQFLVEGTLPGIEALYKS